MKNKNTLNCLLSVLILLNVTLACADGKANRERVNGEKSDNEKVSAEAEEKSCGVNPYLKKMLNARDDREFNELLKIHGPVEPNEMPCILAGIESSDKKKQVFAAQLLSIVRGDENAVLEAEKKVISKTDNVLVWAQIIGSLLYRENPVNAELCAKRPEMIDEALKYTNSDDQELQGKVQSTGLKAGILIKKPGIEEEIKKRLDSNDAELVSVGLDALKPEAARGELTHLLKILDEYEAGKKYTGLRDTVFSSLIDALIRTEDEKAFAASKTALEKGLINAERVGGTREEFGSFRNHIVFVKGEYVEKFCLYLIRENGAAKPTAFDILSTRVWANQQPPNVEAVKECVALIEKGNLSTDPRKHLDDNTGQHDCEQLFFFLETGKNPASEPGVKYGSDALLVGRKWLGSR